jgi:hypothetical protein
MIRNSLRYVSYKDRKAVVKDLRPIYAAASRTDAEAALEAFEAKWGRRYETISSSWRANWERVVPFLDFPPEVRKVIYTTNAIESLNAFLRKLLYYRGHFPSDEAVTKLLYLALTNIEKKWEAFGQRLQQRARPVCRFLQRPTPDPVDSACPTTSSALYTANRTLPTSSGSPTSSTSRSTSVTFRLVRASGTRSSTACSPSSRSTGAADPCGPTKPQST